MSWLSDPISDGVHNVPLVACSNMVDATNFSVNLPHLQHALCFMLQGFCDIMTGQCDCRSGYEGRACERSESN
jgi:hypothetical protein